MTSIRLTLATSIFYLAVFFCNSAFSEDVFDSATQRLEQNGDTIKLDSPIMSPMTSGWISDFCARCNCCKNNNELSWSSIKNRPISGALGDSLIVIPKSELSSITSFYNRRKGGNWIPSTTWPDRGDICISCGCCTGEGNKFDWSRVNQLSDSQMQTLQQNFTIIPSPEFNEIIDKAFK